MTIDTCDHPGCSNPIAYKCSSCGQAFCPRHCQLQIAGTEYSTHGSYTCDVCRILDHKRSGIPLRRVGMVIVQEPLSTILDYCVNVLQTCGMKVTSTNPGTGEVKADVKGSFWEGPGEVVTISTMKTAGTEIILFVESKSKWPTQMIDMTGRIGRNVERILGELSKRIEFRYWPR